MLPIKKPCLNKWLLFSQKNNRKCNGAKKNVVPDCFCGYGSLKISKNAELK